MQDFFSPETEAKLNGAICVIGSQKVNKVANGLPLSANEAPTHRAKIAGSPHTYTAQITIFESGGISGIPKIPKLPLTVPKSPAFTKRKPAPLRSAVMPSKPHTNYTQTQDSIKTKAGITQRGLVTSAESARRLSQERLKRSAHHDHVNTSRSKLGRSQLTKPALTVPEPFSFVTDARGERYQEQFRNKLVRWKQIEKEQQFKALPLPVYPELFIPKKSTKPLTHTEAIALQTDKRAEEREVYEQERRRKEELLQDMLAEKARDDELREQQELRELRKRLVPHPTPIREYPRIEIHKSTRLLTVPHSPNIGEKRKRQMTLERELSTYEDQYHSQAVPAPSNRQYSRTDLEQQLERELKRENERAQERDFERRRVSNSNARDHGEQQQRQNMVREEIERQRERDAYYRQVQQQQRQHVQRQSYSGEYQEFAQEGMQDGFEDGHEPAKRSRIFEEEEEDTPHVHMQSNFCRRMGRKSWLEANDL
ncbi:Protein tpx2 [Mortierella sp. GBA30]|nr:Protein tpx2 [Mortierella sp. GBA30]